MHGHEFTLPPEKRFSLEVSFIKQGRHTYGWWAETNAIVSSRAGQPFRNDDIKLHAQIVKPSPIILSIMAR